jgi:hypothetical protein
MTPHGNHSLRSLRLGGGLGRDCLLVSRTVQLDSQAWEPAPEGAALAILGRCWQDQAGELRSFLARADITLLDPRRLSDQEVRRVLERQLAEPSGGLRLWRSKGPPPVWPNRTVPIETVVAEAIASRRAPQEQKRRTIELERYYHDDTPIQGAAFKVKLSDGSVREGTLDASGRATVEDVPDGSASVQFGPDARPWEPVDKEKNPDFKEAFTSADVDALIARTTGTP